MNLQQLITFSTVISEGSMTAAAEKLYLTQPAVSQQIRNLEEELGVNLLDRGVRNARPTVQGQLLYEYAKKIIALTQQAQVAIQTMGEGIQGSLRIGTLNSLGLQLLSPAAASFLKYNNKINLQLTYGEGGDIIRALKKGELDVAVLPDVTSEYGTDTAGLDSRLLMKDEMWLVASGRESGVPQNISIKDIANKPFIRITERYAGFEKSLKAELDKANVKLKTVFESNNVGTLKRVVESGLGWGYLPSHSIKKQVRMGRLTLVEVNELKYSMPVHYYFREKDPAVQVIDVFFRALKQQGVGG